MIVVVVVLVVMIVYETQIVCIFGALARLVEHFAPNGKKAYFSELTLLEREASKNYKSPLLLPLYPTTIP